jgi:thiamine pyrophosphate-dependent acetolactate synthase large subunit-like protein
MSTEAQPQTQVHGGRLVARRLKAHGVTKLFTLSGGHIFSIYDGCREEGIDIVDVRHEQAAAFAAEGWAKVTREPGVAALTAGPGVTNGMSAMASAQMNNSPMVVLGGRAPAMRWGQGSLQEIDHVPFVRPVTKFAATPESTAEIPGLVDEAFAVAMAAHTGPTFVDFPLDYVFMEAPTRTGRMPKRRCLRWRRSCGSRCSSTAWRVAACPPTTSCSSPARADTASRARTSRWSWAFRWTSAWASVARSARRPT